MKKVEFDFLQRKFLIESDEEYSDEFIREYTHIFLDKLDNFIIPPIDSPQTTFLNTITNSSTESLQVKESHSEPSKDDIIDIFGINAKKLSYLIDFNNDTIKIIVRNKFLKGSKAEMQVKLSLLYCGACDYKNINANTKEIRNICNSYQCLDSNFAQNIKKQNYFNMVGAVNADIKLTMPGKDRLIEVVQEIIAAMDIS